MKHALGFLALALATTFAAGTVSAQKVQPAVALSVGPVGGNLSTACAAAPANCGAITTVGPTLGSPAYWVYMVALPETDDGTAGVSGIGFGIWYEYNNVGGTYTGAYVGAWIKCSDLAFVTTNPAWPRPGAGASLTWSLPPNGPCPTDRHFRVGGVLEVSLYSAALMQVTPHPAGQREFAIVNCQGATRAIAFPAGAGWVSLAGASSGGDNDGCNPCLGPCLAVATEPNTWGKLKRTFGNGE